MARPTDVDDGFARACRAANGFNRGELQPTMLNRIKIGDINGCDTEIAVMIQECDRISAAKLDREVAIPITGDGVDSCAVKKIDDADNSCHDVTVKKIVQTVSVREGSENSDSTLTIA